MPSIVIQLQGTTTRELIQRLQCEHCARCNKSGSGNLRIKGSFRSFGLSRNVTAKLTINGGLSQGRAIPL